MNLPYRYFVSQQTVVYQIRRRRVGTYLVSSPALGSLLWRIVNLLPSMCHPIWEVLIPPTFQSVVLHRRKSDSYLRAIRMYHLPQVIRSVGSLNRSQWAILLNCRLLSRSALRTVESCCPKVNVSPHLDLAHPYRLQRVDDLIGILILPL